MTLTVGESDDGLPQQAFTEHHFLLDMIYHQEEYFWICLMQTSTNTISLVTFHMSVLDQKKYFLTTNVHL